MDHLSWSPGTLTGALEEVQLSKRARKEASVNGHTAPGEKMHHDTLDKLASTLKEFKRQIGVVPGLLKASMYSNISLGGVYGTCVRAGRHRRCV